MDLHGILQRVEVKAAELGTTPNAIGTAAGKPWLVPNIKKAITQGRTSVSVETIALLAKQLRVSTAWLMEGDDGRQHIDSSAVIALLEPRSNIGQVRVVGYVGAGGEQSYYRYSRDQFDYVDPPPGATDQTVAVEIKGGSLGDAFQSAYVFYSEVRSPITADLFGKLCVVGLSDDRILVKIIKREADGSFTLRSNADVEPPIPNANIEWASRVIDVRLR